ncbi:MAG: hypothetical protein HYU52_14335 [Acidobacteria bacterium]|nr:hypothetical protein [Acidobacteriota bacterium]
MTLRSRRHRAPAERTVPGTRMRRGWLARAARLAILALSCSNPLSLAAQAPRPCPEAGIDSASMARQRSSPEVGTTVELSWQAAAGAAAYDVFLGPFDPPAPYAEGLTTTSVTASGLAPGTKYYWYVVAHAECDRSLTSRSTTRSFMVDGACGAVGAVSLEQPPNGASEVSENPTFEWVPASGAASYELQLGKENPPSLIASGTIGDKLDIPHLLPNTTYFWRIVARSGCNAAASSASSVFSFTTGRSCAAPPATSIVFAPRSDIALGQVYAIAWADVEELDPAGSYIIERASDSSFESIIDRQQTTSTAASFIPPSIGSFHHRVRAVAGCDGSRMSAWSSSRSVNAVAGRPNVVFSVPPTPVMAAIGERLEDSRSSFTIENIGPAAVPVFVGRQEISSVPFFQVIDPLGGDASFFTLQPGQPKTLELRFSGPPNTAPGSYQGLLTLATPGEPFAVTPMAWVSLRVGPGTGATPAFLVGGIESDYAVFPAKAGDDSDRPALSVDILNPGSQAMDLTGFVAPEMWLLPEAGWNASPIPAGSFRPLRLYTKRTRAPNGSALPRYTFLTVVTRDGKSARLLVQDSGALETTTGRPAPEPGDRSYIVPVVTTRLLPTGGKVVSRIRITNVSGEATQAQITFTPSDTNGFDGTKVKRATVIVPPNDVVTLTDPLAQVLGVSAPLSGQLEIRAAPERLSTLVVAASVETIEKGGGSRGFVVPVAMSGEGARIGSPHFLAGIIASSALTTDLTLAETTGREATSVRVTLFDAQGTKVGERNVTVPPFGRSDIAGVAQALGAQSMTGGRAEIETIAGGGAVVATALVRSTANESGAMLVSRLAVAGPAASRLARDYDFSSVTRTQSAASSGASAVESLVVPYLVNGVAVAPGIPQTWRTVLTLAAPRDSTASFSLTFRDSVSNTSHEAIVDLTQGTARDYTSAAEQLFGIAPGATARGFVLVSVTGRGRIWARIVAELPGGASGDAIPVASLDSEAISGSSTAKPLFVDGLEQSTDSTRGSRSTLILDELSGRAATVRVRLYEAGNRTHPIASNDIMLPARGQISLDSIFSALGLEATDRNKDRVNVQCVVTPVGTGGLVVATLLTVDNKTGEASIRSFQPAGNSAVTGVQRVSLQPTVPGRRRPVRRN